MTPGQVGVTGPGAVASGPVSTPTAAGGAVAAIRPQRTVPVGLADLSQTAGAKAPTGLAGLRDRRVTSIPASILPGDLYAALPGALTHGAAFAANAAAAGAVAVLTDPAGEERARAAGLPVLVVAKPRDVLGAVASRIYGEPTSGLRLLGVTGTNGKTTTSYLLDAVLRTLGQSP